MMVEELVRVALDGAEKALVDYYVTEICDDETEEDALKYVESLKLNKEQWEFEVFHKKIDRLYDLIRYIKKTEMNEDDKIKAVDYIKSTEIFNEHEKRIAMMFANHFVKFKDVYLQ